MQQTRIIPIAIMGCIGVIALTFGWWLWLSTQQSPPQPVLNSALLYPQSKPLGDFTLQSSDGSVFKTSQFKNHWSLVFFGFTHCPDVCPTTLATLAQTLTYNQEANKKLPLQILFISVDPERDTLPELQRYTQYFNPAIIAATGDHETLQYVTRQMNAVYMTNSEKNGNYSVDHSAHITVINTLGQITGIFRPPFDAKIIMSDLRAIANTEQ